MIAVRLGAFALGLVLAGPALADVAPPPALDTFDFVRACAADPALAENPALESTVAVKTVCSCIAGHYEWDYVSQSDVDTLTKWRLGTLSDQERIAYETFEDLLAYDSSLEEECVASWQTADH